LSELASAAVTKPLELRIRKSVSYLKIRHFVRKSVAPQLITVAMVFSACAETHSGFHANEISKASIAPPRDHVFYVGSRRWHSSIIVERAAIPKNVWPPGVVTQTFRGCRYIEVGWGDADFYMARHPTVLTALNAVFLPGPSVLLLVGLDPPLERALPWGGLVRVPCTAAEFNALCREIAASFRLDENGHAQLVGVGLYGRTSRFYAAHGLYSGVNTCTHWTTRTMRAGGLRASLAPNHTWSSGAVVAQARALVAKRQKN
jgi:uncharacterized protein (TIGR02117 family)